MHAFLIIGKTQDERRVKAEDLLEKENADKVFVLLPKKEKHAIASIREIIRSLKMRHYNSEKKRGVVIEDAEKLTIEAANAFLKTLEEPPKDTIIILTAPNRESVLETIASRCFIKDLGPAAPGLSDEFLKESKELFGKLTKGGIGERIKFVEGIKDREQGTLFLKGQIYTTRKLLLGKIANNPQNKGVKSLVKTLEFLEQARQDLEANVNPKLTLTELLLNYTEVSTG